MNRPGLPVALAAIVVATPLSAQTKLPEGTLAERNLAYGAHERQKLDLFRPRTGGPFPLVLWVHGGAWEGGSKDGTNPAAGLLARGYAVASTNYRLSRHATFPAQAHDVRAAVRLLRAEAKKYDLDPDRFGACGASAGGHLVALLGTGCDVRELDGDGGPRETSCRVQCVIDFFGPTDLARLSPPRAPANPVSRLLGGPPDGRRALASLGNPITHVTKDDPPFLIVHGTKDGLVPMSQSELLHEALRRAGVDSTLKVVRDAGHGNGIFTPELLQEYTAFFDRHLKKK